MTAHPQLPRRSPEEQIRLEASLRDVFEHKLCFNELLGFKVESLDPTAPQISFMMRKELIGHFLHGRLHGGVIATVLDTVGGLAATVAIAEKFNDETTEQVAHRFGRIGTIDLRTDFLRQGIGKKFTATGRITRLGGRIASVQMTLENETGLLIATGSASYVIS
ncbi:thioesterase family protein [Dechloromonas sp. HYN0024]|uniref:thioesterase family protein n=1 Tax=Dechloromonas sp. HYN0024 TaxID=2231055 RepID=UPI000E44D935|nr:thioesterase family protein [Dechloromonas sp. HYN0024]AXS78900.1 thioesterase family protein [Dechloromonas sp. HYN0024]